MIDYWVVPSTDRSILQELKKLNIPSIDVREKSLSDYVRSGSYGLVLQTRGFGENKPVRL